MKSYTIHLIRHGISQGNLEGRYIGSTDSPLAPEGIARLNQLKSLGAYPEAEAYFSSPLKRSIQTIKLLYPEVQPVLIDDFRECDFGDWEGKTAEELSNDPTFAKWVESGSAVTPPNGENGGVFMQRVCAAFEKIVDSMLRSGTTSAVIVAHGGTLMSILSMYGLPRANYYDWMTEPGGGYSLRITPGLWARSMVAEVYATIPAGKAEDSSDSKLVIDLAREAADRTFGKNGKKEKNES